MTVEGYNTKAIWTLCVSGVCVNVRHMLEGWKLLYIYCMINDNGYCQTHKPKWRRDEAEKHFVALYLKGLHRPCLVMYCSVPRHITYKPCTILNTSFIPLHHICYMPYWITDHTEPQGTHVFFMTLHHTRGLQGIIYLYSTCHEETDIHSEQTQCLFVHRDVYHTDHIPGKKKSFPFAPRNIKYYR